jgi:hypothetical protein
MDISKTYFRQVPNFDYVSRVPNETQIGNYVTVKNLFKRAKIRDDIFGKLNFFEKYKIEGDERPDQVALKYYNNEAYDWLVLLSNNIQNVQTEWPLPQEVFDSYVIKKYGSYEKLNEVKYYESIECKDSNGIVIFPSGIKVDENYSFTYYDNGLGSEKIFTEMSNPVTYYEYESEIENNKRNIYLLKTQYLSIILNDLESLMTYKKGSTQYVDKTLKKGDNIKLYPN